MGNVGVEPTRLSAHDPKSCSSANSDNSPMRPNYNSFLTLTQGEI